MTYNVNGKSITLNRKEVKAAKKMFARYLKIIKDSARKRHLPTFFFTFLIVANVMTQEALEELSPESLSLIMNEINKNRI